MRACDTDSDTGTGTDTAPDPTRDLARPRLRADHPLLWRSDGRVQAGIGDHAAPLGTLSAAEMTWLAGVDGTRTRTQVHEHARTLGLDAERIRQLLDRLTAHGALDDAAAMPDAMRWRELAQREPIAGDTAAAGFAYGSAVTANLVLERRLTTRIAVIGSGALAQAVADALHDSGLQRADPTTADLRIRIVEHPALVEPGDLMPHLQVAVFGDTGRIGPLVMPGRTACLRCLHLHRRDADPSWPVLVLQFEHALARMHPRPMDRLLARATATAAVLLVRRWADDPLAEEAWADQELVVHLPDGSIERRACPPHALCGCRWPVPAGG